MPSQDEPARTGAHLDPVRLLHHHLTDDERDHLSRCQRCSVGATRLRDVAASLESLDATGSFRTGPRGGIGALLRETWREWREDRATAHSAALAFYALFASAPMALLATLILGWLVGAETAERELRAELDVLLSPEVTRSIGILVRATDSRHSGVAATGFGLAVAIYGSLRGFYHLQATLNQMWGVRSVRGPGLLSLLRSKALAFASIALCGVLLLVSIGLSMMLHYLVEHATTPAFLQHWWTIRIGEETSTLVLVAVLLTVVYKTLPDARIRWRDVLVGAFTSAVLFVIGKYAVTVYLRHLGLGSRLGAATAMIAILLYVQYISYVLLLGAEFTYVFAWWKGQPIRPGPGAARVVRTVVHEEPWDQPPSQG